MGKIKEIVQGILGANSPETNEKEIVQEVVVPRKRRAAYYRYTHIFVELLEKYQIRYFAHSGTMLGCVRHGGFIPWDDDVDFMIPEEDALLMHELVQDIEKYGIQQNLSSSIKPEDGLWQFRSFGEDIMQGLKGGMGLDVFVGEEVELENGDRVYHYKSKDFRNWYPDRYVKIDDVFPRKRYRFGPLSIWGMKNPEDYFRRSGFKMDEAIIGVHKKSKAKAKRVISRLKKQGKYPIQNEDILKMKSPYARTDFFELEYYRDAGKGKG